MNLKVKLPGLDLKNPIIPATFAIIGKSYWARNGSLSLITTSKPGFCKPIEFNIPAVVSAILTPSFPLFTFSVVALIIIEPRIFKS